MKKKKQPCSKCGISTNSRHGLCRQCWASSIAVSLVVCSACGASFKPDGRARKFCSKTCFGLQERGDQNRNWQGGKAHHVAGYVLIHAPEHPHANSNGYVPEHRLVMEKHIGRALHNFEVVHHRDGDKANNELSNLELMTRGGHSVHHNRRPDLVPEVDCRACGRTFKGRRYVKDGTLQTFCSRACYWKARTGIPRSKLAEVTGRIPAP